MSLVGTRSRVSPYFYASKESVIITSDIWNRDKEYPTQLLPHVGYDYRAALGTPLTACFDGVVVHVDSKLGSSYGRQVFIYNKIVDKTAHYAHLSSVAVKVGQSVLNGERIGLSGASGVTDNAYMAHLHFGMAKGCITNAGYKGVSLGDSWLDVELFDFSNITGLMALKPFKFSETVNVRSFGSLVASKKDQYKPGEILNLFRPLGTHNMDGYVWVEYISSRGTRSAVAVYDVLRNEWYGKFQ